MALSGPSTVRVRVCFDYPPPALPDCRMCWVLVDLNRCRVVADLASVIRDKLEFSRRTVLNLFMEDCYLPPAESAHVVRDNDTIRVKVDVLPQVNGWAPGEGTAVAAPIGRKRRRDQLAEEEEVLVVKKRRKKKKRRQTESVEEAPLVHAEQETTTKKKKNKEDKRGTGQLAVPAKPVCPQKAPVVPKEDGKQSGAAATRRTVGKKRVSSSSETSSSEEEPPRKGALQGGCAVSKPTAKPTAPSSPDSSSDSSYPAVQREGKASQTAPKNPSAAAGSSCDAAGATEAKVLGATAKSSSSDSSSEMELVIKRPDPAVLAGLPPLGFGRGGQQPKGVGRGCSTAGGRGRGNIWPSQKRGGGRGAVRGGHGMGRGGPLPNGPPFPGQNGQQKQHQDEVLTNHTVVLQNPLGHAPPRDYSSLPLLAAPPAVGQKIAFKLLELTENYTPEVSDYKEGKIIGFNHTTNQVELELLSSVPAPSEPGKFDLVYQAPDGSEVVEYAVSRGSQLTERWESLLEPRLLVENLT